MYQIFKSIIKNLFPEQIVQQFKPLLRNVVYLFYKGNKYACNLCEANLKTFLSLANNDLLCPRCGSLSRTRKLYQILEEKQLLKGKILHFSPPLSLNKKINQTTDIQYISSDFENEFIADVKYDLTNISAKDETFDLFIAYHILEHIEADSKAMEELFRISKKGGFGLIQTPFKTGEIYEDFSIKTPKERLTHFGQEDHVRIYSVEGLRTRLEKVGFKVDELSFKEKESNYFGFKLEETVLLVSKI